MPNNSDVQLMRAAVLESISVSNSVSDPASDFDFLMGDWNVLNRKLLHLFQNSDQWEEFEATSKAQKLPAGIGNFDEFRAPLWRPDFVGMSLRVYDRSQQRWSIYWLNNQNGGTDAASGALLPPVVGGFKNGIGIFEGNDHIAGQDVLVRYIWSGVTTEQPRWEQEFSNDQGKSWETNWIMQFSPL